MSFNLIIKATFKITPHVTKNFADRSYSDNIDESELTSQELKSNQTYIEDFKQT